MSNRNKKTASQAEGQFNLADLFGDAFLSFDSTAEPTAPVKKSAPKKVIKPPAVKMPEAPVPSAKEKVLADLDEYLKKGERLPTLARLKNSRFMAGLTLSEREKALYGIKLPDYYGTVTLHDLVQKKVIRPMLKAEEEYSEDGELMKFLRANIDFTFSLKRINGSDYACPAARALMRKDKKSPDLLLLTVSEPDWPDLKLLGYRCYASGAKVTKCTFWYSDDVQVADIADVLSWLILITLYNRAMADDGKIETIEAAYREEWDKRNRPGGWANVCSQVVIDSGVSGVIDAYSATSSTLSMSNQLVLPWRVIDRPSQKFVEFFAGYSGADVSSAKPFLTHEDDARFHSVNTRHFAESGKKNVAAWKVTKYAEQICMAKDPLTAKEYGFAHVGYNELLHRATYFMNGSTEPGDAPMRFPSMYTSGPRGAVIDTMRPVLAMIWAEKAAAINQSRYYRALEKTSRATAYQTKKNIPLKVLREMADSPFNDYFGYTEIDEDCDLKKIERIAEEFIAVKETYLKGLDLSGVSLRFRKLGNYKAAGLYFFGINCLAVDIDNPSSFIHELGHGMDALLGDENGRHLSDLGAFYPVYHKYEALLRTYVQEHRDSLRVKGLHGKYDLNYYLVNTECFARSWEVYVSHFLGVKNSICAPEAKDAFAYPIGDEEYLSLVKDYFDKLLDGISAGVENKKLPVLYKAILPVAA